VSMPFYVSPEQVMKDRADYARKGIARGRSLVAFSATDGIVIVAENPSRTLYKISEIYDRIAFAGVGKYSEFEDLRISGVRLADLRGYSYGREDVKAKDIANGYSQALSGIFTQQMKPYEVELLVSEVGEEPGHNEIYHVLFDGSVTDEQGFVAIGGRSDELMEALRGSYAEAADLRTAVHTAVDALSSVEETSVVAEQLEAGVLERSRPTRRKFRRLSDQEVLEILPTKS